MGAALNLRDVEIGNIREQELSGIDGTRSVRSGDHPNKIVRACARSGQLK